MLITNCSFSIYSRISAKVIHTVSLMLHQRCFHLALREQMKGRTVWQPADEISSSAVAEIQENVQGHLRIAAKTALIAHTMLAVVSFECQTAQMNRC